MAKTGFHQNWVVGYGGNKGLQMVKRSLKLFFDDLRTRKKYFGAGRGFCTLSKLPSKMTILGHFCEFSPAAIFKNRSRRVVYCRVIKNVFRGCFWTKKTFPDQFWVHLRFCSHFIDFRKMRFLGHFWRFLPFLASGTNLGSTVKRELVVSQTNVAIWSCKITILTGSTQIFTPKRIFPRPAHPGPKRCKNVHFLAS